MGQKKDVTLEDIARELGISIVSASNALKGKKGVREELRRQVSEKAEEMGYQLPQPSARRITKCYCIGVVIAERYVKEYPSFYMETYRQVAQLVTKQGSLTVLEIVDLDKELMQIPFQLFLDVQVQGIIFIGEMNMDFILSVKAAGAVPVVCIDFYSTEKGMDYLVTDSFGGMQLMTQRLVDAGHKDIGFVGNPHATNSIMDRYMGYCKVLKLNGLTERRDRVLCDREINGYVIDFELPQELPTAFVCNCDKSAYVLIEKLNRLGLRVPEDISVVGFDGFDSSAGRRPEGLELTTYESDQKAMAQIGVNTLMKRIEKNTKPENIRTVEGRVREGNTVGRCTR